MSYPTEMSYPDPEQCGNAPCPYPSSPTQGQFVSRQQQENLIDAPRFGPTGQNEQQGSFNFSTETPSSLGDDDETNNKASAWPSTTVPVNSSAETAIMDAAPLSMPGANDWNENTNDIGAGLASYYRARRRLNIANDNYDELSRNNAHFVRLVHAAIMNTPDSMEEDQVRANNGFEKRKNGLGQDADQFLRDISSMCIAAIHDLHFQGDNLFESQYQNLRPRPADKTLTATERVNAVCDMLFTSKKIVTDLMDGGYDAIVRLVAAPTGKAYCRMRYKDNNDARAKKNKRLRQLQASQDDAGQLGGAVEAEDDVGDEDLDVERPPKRRKGGRTRTDCDDLMPDD